MHHLYGDLLFSTLKMQAGHALVGALVLISDMRISPDGTREHAEISHLTDEKIGRGLPDISGQRLRVGGL